MENSIAINHSKFHPFSWLNEGCQNFIWLFPYHGVLCNTSNNVKHFSNIAIDFLLRLQQLNIQQRFWNPCYPFYVEDAHHNFLYSMLLAALFLMTTSRTFGTRNPICNMNEKIINCFFFKFQESCILAEDSYINKNQN